MHVDALGLSQEMDFSDGSVTNFLTLRLPSGDIVKALISDESVERIAANLAGEKTGLPVPPPPQPSPPPPRVAPPLQQVQRDEGLDAFVFGGQEAPSAPAPAPPSPTPMARPKIVRVEAGPGGYPIVRHAAGNTVDPDTVFGAGTSLDEDGVGQG